MPAEEESACLTARGRDFGEGLVGVGNLGVGALQVGVVLADEVLQIDHECLRLVANLFLIVGQTLQVVIPLVGIVGFIGAGQIEGQAAGVEKFYHLRGHFRGGIVGLGLILEGSGLFNHFGAQFLLFLDGFNLLHVVFSLRLADFGLGELELGEHHLHAAGGAEVDGVENGGKGSIVVDL